RSRNEEARVLYVAATRAVRHLHLVAVVNRDEDGELMLPRMGSPLARLWSDIEPDFQQAAAIRADKADDRVSGDLAEFVPQLSRLRMPAVPESWSAPARPVEHAGTRDEAVAPLAAAVGVMTHAVLELIAADPDAWTPDRVGERQPGFERWLASRGWSPDDSKIGAARAAQMLRRTLASDDGRWVLRCRDDAAAELALTKLGAGGTAQVGVVDRCFIENGVRWIIDYKTADLGENADIIAATEHAQRFRPQLESYAGLFAAEGLPQRLAVFYVAHGILASLE
ncbi:MAG: DNA helicase, partial [Sulfuritalea sp.]|nr:DNA helicase [Sulfuritalea sp.]